MQDDLESLGYTFLEMLDGDLPWDLTSQEPYDDGDYYSKEQLSNMANKRDLHWEQLCAQGRIPTFLINWHCYVRSLKIFEIPSYAWLFRLLQHSQDKAPTPVKRPRDSAADIVEVPAHAKRLKAENVCAAEE